MIEEKRIDIRDLIDKGPIRPLQWTVLWLCGVCTLIDGFDIQLIGFVAPAIAEEWGVQPAALGSVFAAGLLGMVLGSAIFSLLADRFGRRPLMIIAMVSAGLGMWATSRVESVEELLIMRFLTGVPLGSVMPVTLALASEYSPARVRVGVAAIVASGLTAGAIIAGSITSTLGADWGWRGVFVLGGVSSMVLGAVMALALPESLRFMGLRQASQARLGKLLKRLQPDLDSAVRYELALPADEPPKLSVAHLFSGGRAPMTLLLWSAAFMTLVDLYFLANWLPSVTRAAGHATGAAVLASTMLQVGGLVGGLTVALLSARLPARPILMVGYLLASVAILSLGLVIGALPQVLVAAAIAGCCIIGGQAGLNSLTATYYPTAVRSTGVGWMLAVGRFGSILGPLIGGWILQMKLGADILFLFAAIPAVIAAVCVWAMSRIADPANKGVSGRIDEDFERTARTTLPEN